MQHRIQELDMDEELALARENAEYLAKKRDSLHGLRADRSDEREPAKKKRWPFFCCVTVLFVTLAAMGLIYYFVANIKDGVFKEYLDKKGLLEQSMPQGKEEVKKSLEQGEALLNETAGNVDSAGKAVDQAKDTIDGAKKVYDKGKAVYDTFK